MNLTVTDTKILTQLCFDARRPINQIAKDLRLAKSTVLYRIKRMEELGIIKGYTCRTNHSQRGTINARLDMRLTNKGKHEKKQIAEKLTQINGLEFIATTNGFADIILTAYIQSIEEFMHIIQIIRQKIGKWILSQNISLASSVYYAAPNIILGKELIPPVKSGFPGNKKSIPSFDEKLLSLLKKDPQKNVIDIAKSLACSTKKVISHKNTLEKNNTILCYVPKINVSKLGYSLYHVRWKLESHINKEFETICNYILEQKQTAYLTIALSQFDLESTFYAKNERELINLITNIQTIFPHLISDYETALILDVVKE